MRNNIKKYIVYLIVYLVISMGYLIFCSENLEKKIEQFSIERRYISKYEGSFRR